SPPRTYALSLHDALPICRLRRWRETLERGEHLSSGRMLRRDWTAVCRLGGSEYGLVAFWHTPPSTHAAGERARGCTPALADRPRSEEHTSELQSPDHLVC